MFYLNRFFMSFHLSLLYLCPHYCNILFRWCSCLYRNELTCLSGINILYFVFMILVTNGSLTYNSGQNTLPIPNLMVDTEYSLEIKTKVNDVNGGVKYSRPRSLTVSTTEGCKCFIYSLCIYWYLQGSVLLFMSHECILSNSIVLYQSTPVSGYTDCNFLLSAPTIHTLVESETTEVT